MTKTTKIRTEQIMVTPQLAEKWLEGNTHNRPLRANRVEQYASDMKGGRWRLTHQGVAFSDTGVLLDGQHRLYAIWQTGIPIEMMVTYGLPEDSQQFIDEGLPRSVVDVQKLSGDSKVNTYRVAVARRMLIGTRTQVIMTRQEQIEFLQNHETALDFVLDEVFQGKKRALVMPAPVGAAVGRAFYHEDKARLKEFGAILLGGMPSGGADSGAHLLCQWLLARAPEHGQKISKEVLIYTKAERAIVAFINRENLRTLYPAKDEQWPLTGEMRRRPAPAKKK